MLYVLLRSQSLQSKVMMIAHIYIGAGEIMLSGDSVGGAVGDFASFCPAVSHSVTKMQRCWQQIFTDQSHGFISSSFFMHHNVMKTRTVGTGGGGTHTHCLNTFEFYIIFYYCYFLLLWILVIIIVNLNIIAAAAAAGGVAGAKYY